MHGPAHSMQETYLPRLGCLHPIGLSNVPAVVDALLQSEGRQMTKLI